MSDAPQTNFVAAVASVSGGGKTTLVRRATELLNGTALFLDDYGYSQYPKDIKKWIEDGADVNEWTTPRYARDVAALRNGESVTHPRDGTTVFASKYIVIEEPSGRARAEMAPHIDYVVVIDTPLEIALARRILRDVDAFSIKKLCEATVGQTFQGYWQLRDYLQGSLGSYLDTVRDVCVTFQARAMATCDLVLDGRLPPSELAKQLVTALKRL